MRDSHLSRQRSRSAKAREDVEVHPLHPSGQVCGILDEDARLESKVENLIACARVGAKGYRDSTSCHLTHELDELPHCDGSTRGNNVHRHRIDNILKCRETCTCGII